MTLGVENVRELAALFDQWRAADALPLVEGDTRRDQLRAQAQSRGPAFAKAFAAMTQQSSRGTASTLFPQLPNSLRHAAARSSAQEDALNHVAPPREAGQRIGPYRLIRELGRGGMGVVWLAARADGQHERQVALKMPLVENLNWLLAARFARERNILASLEHPGIARLYDAGVDTETQPYIALEYVVGVPITEYVRKLHLNPEAIVALFIRVINAVAHAHAQLVIHRDIKPSNVLVDQNGEPHLLDFGIAKLLDDEEELNTAATQLTRLSGRALTLDYASPEQINGQALGTASDVYALGVVLYELLTGQLPHVSDAAQTGTRRELELAIIEQEPAKPSARLQLTGTSEAGKTARRIRGDLDTVVLKALKKKPIERYATAQAFADDLKRYIAHEPISAKPDSEWYRVRKFARRNRLAMLAAVAVAVAITAGVVSTIWQSQRTAQEASRANIEAARAITAADDARKQATLAANEARRADQQASTASRERDRADAEARQATLDRDRVGAALVSTKAAEIRARESAQLAMEQREFAIDSRERSEAVQSFFSKLMGSASKDGGAFTSAQWLERGVQDATKRYQDNPALRASILAQIGSIYLQLGQSGKALELAKAAVEAARHEKNQSLRAELACFLAHVTSNRDPKAALVIVKEALASLSDKEQDQSAMTICLMIRGITESYSNLQAQSLATFESADRLFSRQTRPDKQREVELLNMLASGYFLNNRFDQSEATFLRLEQKRIQYAFQETAGAAVQERAWAHSRFVAGDALGSLERLRVSEKITERLGTAGSGVYVLRETDVLFAMGRYQEVRVKLNDLLARTDQPLPLQQRRAALETLFHSERKLGNPEAATLHLAAYEDTIRSVDPKGVESPVSQLKRAQLLRVEGKLTDAKLKMEGIVIALRARTNLRDSLAEALAELALVESALGDHATAKQLIREATDVQSALIGASRRSFWLGQLLAIQGDIALAAAEKDNARKYYEDALRQHRPTLGADAPAD